VQHFEKGSTLDDVESSVATKRYGADGKGLGADLLPKLFRFEIEQIAGDSELEDVEPSGAGQKIVQHEITIRNFHVNTHKTICSELLLMPSWAAWEMRWARNALESSLAACADDGDAARPLHCPTNHFSVLFRNNVRSPSQSESLSGRRLARSTR
jgi:hypothetical protein